MKVVTSAKIVNTFSPAAIETVTRACDKLLSMIGVSSDRSFHMNRFKRT